MNISPANNFQPSFKGVILPADFMNNNPIVIDIVPDETLKGVKFGERCFDSEFADILTRIHIGKERLEDVVNKYPQVKSFGDKPLIRQIIEQLNLGNNVKNALFTFLKKARDFFEVFETGNKLSLVRMRFVKY